VAVSVPALPLVIGHRGAPAELPEHTREGYLRAFEQGAELVEPDLVASRDGVLVVRHENEISGTTDIASRPEFAERRTTRTVDGRTVEGWFTEDFTWAELSTLRCRERLPLLRPDSAAHDGEWRILRLEDLLTLVDEAQARLGRRLGVVAELKHSRHFRSIGLELEPLLAAALRATGWADADDRLVVESFERSALQRAREEGVPGSLVYLIEAEGAPPDERARLGERALPYAAQLTDAGLAALAAGEGGAAVDGISVDKVLLLDAAGGGAAPGAVPGTAPGGSAAGAASGQGGLVERAHDAGLTVFTWTLRAENAFLEPRFRRGEDPAAPGDWRAEWSAVYASGVDAVFADAPGLAVRLRATAGGRAARR